MTKHFSFPFFNLFSIRCFIYTIDKNCTGIQSQRHDTESRVSRRKIYYWKWFLKYTTIRQEMKKLFPYKILTLHCSVHMGFRVAKNKILSMLACFKDNIKVFLLFFFFCTVAFNYYIPFCSNPFVSFPSWIHTVAIGGGGVCVFKKKI